jgi:hypothetical protein
LLISSQLFDQITLMLRDWKSISQDWSGAKAGSNHLIKSRFVSIADK